MHSFSERVLVLKNFCKRFYIRPKLQLKWQYQTQVVFFQAKILTLYPGFTRKIPESKIPPPGCLTSWSLCGWDGWAWAVPFPGSGEEVRGQGAGCPLLQLVLAAWGRLMVVVRCPGMIQLSPAFSTGKDPCQSENRGVVDTRWNQRELRWQPPLHKCQLLRSSTFVFSLVLELVLPDILRRKTVLLLVLSLEPQTWDLRPSHCRHTIFTLSLA